MLLRFGWQRWCSNCVTPCPPGPWHPGRGVKRPASAREITFFYDALAENQSAHDVMGEPALGVVAHELVTSLRNSVTVDWMHREPRVRGCGCWWSAF